MNKKLFKIIVIILLIVLRVPDVKAAIKSIHNISPEENVTYISYDKTAKEVSFDVGNEWKNDFGIGDLKKLDNKKYRIRKFLYYKKGFSKKGKDYLITKKGNTAIATLTIKDAAYWCENNFCKSNDDKERLNIVIKLNSVKIGPTVSGNKNKCKTNYIYGLFSYDSTDKGVNVFSSTRTFSESDKKQVPTPDTKNCGANVELGYTITLEGSLPEGAFRFVWTIKDIDQPDKTKFNKNNQYANYSGSYVESINFSKGFINDYYVYEESLLKNSKNSNTKFIATTQTGNAANNQPSVEKSTVLTFQNDSEAEIIWTGSRDVETTIIGDNIDFIPKTFFCWHDESNNKYYGINGNEVDESTFWDQCFTEDKKYKYIGDHCAAEKESPEVECGKDAGVIEDKERDPVDIDLPYKKDVKVHSKPHTSCNAKDIEFNNLYFKEKEGTIVSDFNGNEIERCVHVKVVVPIVMLEDMKLFVGALDSSIYAGGGFKWDTTILTNSINWKWRYQRSLEDSDDFKNVFLIYFSHRVDDKTVPPDYFTSSDVELYSDDKCNNVVDLESENWLPKKISELYESGDVELDTKFKATTDYNDVAIKDATVPLGSKINTVDGGGYFRTFTNTVSLKNAYINPWNANITYEEDHDDDYIDSGSKYYVPLKYTDDTFNIFLGNAPEYKDNSLSVIGQDTKFFKVICDVDVKHIFYEKKDNKLQLAFNYRPIKTDDVFNGKSKDAIASRAENWADWYCSNDSCKSTNANMNRIANTFTYKPIYSTTFGNGDEYAKSIVEYNKNNTSYADFSPTNIDINGTSIFVDKKMGFTSITGSKSYCPLGKLLPSGCDEIVSG